MTAGTTSPNHRFSEDAAKASRAPTARKHRRRWWLWMLAVLSVVLWLLPNIVAHTPLLGWGIGMAAADLNGTVTVGSASLGWFSPIAVQDVEITDSEGKLVLSLPSATGDRSLAALLGDYSKLGSFRLESPKLSVVLRDDGSNLEDLLQKYLESEEESTLEIGLSLEVVDGSVLVTDQAAGRSWQAKKLALNFDMPAGIHGPLTVKTSADLPNAQSPGKLNAVLKMDAGLGETTLGTKQFPLAMLRAPVARLVPGTTLAGRLSSDVRATWGNRGKGKNHVQANVATEAFLLATPALQTDVVRLERFQANCEMSWRANRVEIEKSSIDCDVGTVSMTGTIPLKDGFSIDRLAHERQELNGRLDLARLARILPATLRIRRQIQIDSGQVELAVRSQSERQGMGWHGRLDVSKLTGIAAGRRLAWEQPILMVLDAHEGADGPIIDTLRCESDFLKIHAAGTPDEMAASITLNLKQLADQLNQFVDLGNLQLAGEGWGNLNWKRSTEQRFAANAELRLRGFQLSLPDQPPWREENVQTSLSAKGQTDFGANTRIDSAALSVKTGAEGLNAKLIEPVTDLRDGGAWPLRVQMQGQLQNWPARLAAWLSMDGWRFSGAYVLEAEGTASKTGAQVRQARLTVAPLVVASSWLNVNEPRLDVVLAGSWDQQRRCLQLDPANLVCATATVQANGVVLAMPKSGATELTGTVDYQGDVARLRQWFTDAAKPPDWRLAGQLKGKAKLRRTAGVVRGETTAEVVNLAVVDTSGQQFQEPIIRLIAGGDYDEKSQVLKLAQFELTSSALAANVTGRVAPVGGYSDAQLGGQLSYDVERLAGLMRPYLGSEIHVVGRGSSPIWYRGPLKLATGQAAAGLKWDRANAYGFQIGPGELKAAMAGGVVQIEPLDLAVSQGRVNLSPRVRLVPDPIELTLPQGPLARQIQIDPNMCSKLLKYIAPVLADVTSAQGTFSIELDGCRIPLGNPSKGDLAGRFIIHSVAVGPGPLIRELAVFLGRETPAQLRRESSVVFRMVDGRVYHKDLELIFPEFTIRTHGSVGLDQTLAIMAEMPVPPKWIEKNPLAAQALRGQTLRIPIGGTLGKPKLDQKVMEQLTRQFMQKAAENLLEGEINKQLDRLFGPRKN